MRALFPLSLVIAALALIGSLTAATYTLPVTGTGVASGGGNTNLVGTSYDTGGGAGGSCGSTPKR